MCNYTYESDSFFLQFHCSYSIPVYSTWFASRFPWSRSRIVVECQDTLVTGGSSPMAPMTIVLPLSLWKSMLGYYQGQESPYSWYDPYYLEEREEFSYRERSPLRRHSNPRTLIIIGVATDRTITPMYTGSAPITIHNPIQRMANFCKTTKKM